MTHLTRCIVLFFSGLFLFACTPKNGHSSEAAPSGDTLAAGKPILRRTNEIPPITLIEEDGKQFSGQELPGNSILIFFSADCDHCQREATEIQKNLAGFGRYSIYFVSMNPFPEMHKFAETYKLNDSPNVKFLRADGSTVFSAMGSIQTPTICVFNKDKKLSKRFDGETKVAEILKAL